MSWIRWKTCSSDDFQLGSPEGKYGRGGGIATGLSEVFGGAISDNGCFLVSRKSWDAGIFLEGSMRRSRFQVTPSMHMSTKKITKTGENMGRCV